MRTSKMVRRVFPGLIALTLTIAGTGAAVFSFACNSGDNFSPTAPTAPAPAPAPAPAVQNADFRFSIEPVYADEWNPFAGELLVDGRVLWSGTISEPEDPYGDNPAFYIYRYDPTNLSLGEHSFVFRVTDHRRTPTLYSLGGYIGITWWPPVRHVQVARWSDVRVILARGREWSMPFVISSQP